MILGKTNHRWKRDDDRAILAQKRQREFGFRISFLIPSFGLWNIDRPTPPYPEVMKVFVDNEDKHEIMMLFEKSFVLINTSQKGKRAVFNKVPVGKKVTIFAKHQNQDGTFSFGKLSTTTGIENVTIPNIRIYTLDEIESALAFTKPSD